MPEELLHKHFAPYVTKKGEEYMSSRQLAHFRNILETLKAELMNDIERTVHTMQDEATVFADPNDRASQETDIAIELRNRDRGDAGHFAPRAAPAADVRGGGRPQGRRESRTALRGA